MTGQAKPETAKSGRHAPSVSWARIADIDANEALLANIREMMDEMRSDIINKFDSAISERKVNGM